MFVGFLTIAVSSAEDYGQNMWQDTIITVLKTAISFGSDLEKMSAFLSNMGAFIGKVVPDNLSNVINQIAELTDMLAKMVVYYCFFSILENLTGGKFNLSQKYNGVFDVINGVISSGKDSPLLMQHWPETYLAWLRSGTPDEIFTEYPHENTVAKYFLLIK